MIQAFRIPCALSVVSLRPLLPLATLILLCCCCLCDCSSNLLRNEHSPRLSINSRRLDISAGIIVKRDGTTIRVEPTSITIPDSPVKIVTDEMFDLIPPSHQSVNWGCAPAGTKVCGLLQPNSLVKDSLRVKSQSGVRGTPLPPAAYTVGSEWPLINSTSNIPHQKVFLDYDVPQRRICTVAINDAGSSKLFIGPLSLGAPSPPDIPRLYTPIVNIEASTFDSQLHDSNLMPIYTSDSNHPKVDSNTVAKTRSKLLMGKTVTIAFVGDSVTGGAAASNSAKAFPAMFTDQLRKQYPNAAIESVMVAQGGTHSDSQFARFQKRFTTDYPDLVIVEFINDVALDGKTVSDRYSRFIRMLQSHGTESIICLPHLCSPSLYGFKPDDWQSVANKEYYVVVTELCQEMKVGLANVFERSKNIKSEGLTPALLLADRQMHPNDRGHQLYAEELFRFFH